MYGQKGKLPKIICALAVLEDTLSGVVPCLTQKHYLNIFSISYKIFGLNIEVNEICTYKRSQKIVDSPF